MQRDTITFSIQEAGSLLYIADRKFGSFPVNEFHEFFGGRPGLKDLTLSGSVIAGSLYQDDGYNVRIVFGELTEEEARGWTSSVSWKLNISSGQMAVSGVCDDGLEAYLSEWDTAANGGDYELGAFIEVPPGEYSVSIYSYPPNDLAGGWMALSEKRMFKDAFQGLTFEKPLEYFKRTLPGEVPREWIVEGWEDTDFLDFVIRLTPSSGKVQPPDFEDDGTVKWKFRKPEKFPVGIELSSSD